MNTSNKICKILIAENNQNIALDLKQIFESHRNYIIETSNTGLNVVTTFKKTIPDLLIYSLLIGDSDSSLDSIVYYHKKYRFRIIFLAGMMELKFYKK